MSKIDRGSLYGFVDWCILLKGNQVLACNSSQCEKVVNTFAENYSVLAYRSNAPKIEVSFHLLMFGHFSGCLWCEGEGPSNCEVVRVPRLKNNRMFLVEKDLGVVHKRYHFLIGLAIK